MLEASKKTVHQAVEILGIEYKNSYIEVRNIAKKEYYYRNFLKV